MDEAGKLKLLEDRRRSNMKQYGFGPEIMKQIRVCGRCGLPSETDDGICDFCGAELSHETLYEQYRQRHPFCPYCDLVVSDSARFCPECGKKIPPFTKR